MADRPPGLWLDAALAGVLALACAVALPAGDGGSATPGAVLLIAGVCAPVAALRRHPAAAALAAAGVIAGAALTGVDGEPLDVALVAVAALCFGCGAFAGRLRGTLAAGTLCAVLQVVVGIPDDAWVPLLLVTLGPWAAGRVLRARRELVQALAERTRELEAQEAAYTRLAVRRERARIARELHDIVAHHLAVMVVQAGAGRMAAQDPPARQAERLRSIGEAGAQALAEMGRLVDLLHAEADEDPPRERLHRVLDQARAAGLTVRATPLPPGLELPRGLSETVIRIVQEGVTNALKHAPGTEVDVRLALRDGSLEIGVRDRGAAARPTLADTGAGLGLAGLRERVAAAGGHLQAGPAPGGGWRLHVGLPLPAV